MHTDRLLKLAEAGGLPGQAKFSSQADARKAQWFSRRHETSEAHEAAKTRKANHWDRQLATVATNAEARALRAPEEQLAELDRRLGKGVGAKRERDRLEAQILEKRFRKAQRQARIAELTN